LIKALVFKSPPEGRYVQTQWQSAWEEAMAGKFIDLPNLQN